MATKKAVTKTVKKQYAWGFNDEHTMLNADRFDSVEDAMEDMRRVADFNNEDSDIILVEIVKKFSVKMVAQLVEVK